MSSWKDQVILYYSAPLRLSTTDPQGVGGGNVISMYRSHENPSWVAQLRCSVPKTQIRRWLIAKSVLQGLGRHHSLVLLDLAVEEVFASQILSLAAREKSGIDLPYKLSKDSPWSKAALDLCRRILGPTSPRIWSKKNWAPQRTIEGRRIGVGYKDHGTLASGLSWRDQMSLTAEEFAEEKGDEVLHRIFTYLSFSEYAKGRVPPAEESQIGRKGEKKG